MQTDQPETGAARRTRKEEARRLRGKLKIFFGMAAGVGKSYAMLEGGAARRAEGVDVVAGYIETHGRAEMEALLAGLEVLPRRGAETWEGDGRTVNGLAVTGPTVDGGGPASAELDLDALLARKPQLALVDELAHTNAPGQRHHKRYQDILELLAAGIDVYTTANVQDFESRADAVTQITGVHVHEKVPDSLLDLADELELIDLSPAELRKRLAEGKVHTAEGPEAAAGGFFRTGNLTALREMALRLAAEHVDHKLADYMQMEQIAGPWRGGERLLVAVGPGPFSERAVRWTRRMAYSLGAPWLAVYVETSRGLTAAQQEQLAANLELVRSLGGEVVTEAGDDVAMALLHVARQRNVTQIVAGKPPGGSRWNLLRRDSLVNRLIETSDGVDIYVVAGPHASPGGTAGGKGPASSPRLPAPAGSWTESAWVQAGLALAIVAGVTAALALAHLAYPWLPYQAVGLIELFVVLLIAVYLGRGPALAAAFASAFSWNYLFINPRLTLAISALPDNILFVLYFVIALVAGTLTARLRQQERLARHNAERTAALYALAHDTATAVDMDDVLATAIDQIGRVFQAEVAILLPGGDQLARRAHGASTLPVDEGDFAAAAWVFANGKAGGRHTATHAGASAQYLPLQTPSRIVGVIGIRTQQAAQLTFEQEQLLETFVSQIALVIERELLDEAAEQALMLRESERLYTALLNSISHELRTPIATISGAAGLLAAPERPGSGPGNGSGSDWERGSGNGLGDEASGGAGVRAELLRSIQGAAARLNRLVANLLDMSRLDAGRVRLKLDWCDVGEVIGVAAQRVEECMLRRPFSIDVPRGLPLVQMDFVLMEQVLVNLLDNACSYSPPETPIAIGAQVEAGALRISVTDAGKGIPPDDLERIFDKFYRVPGTAPGGTGLGLSICRGLVEAHGGSLAAENVAGGGARFIITLPAGAPPPVKEADL